ncbi:MAG: hypothetical protein J5I94_02395, partial [Phaeodactylibacter sp.]|nr:hypothetical protein [Phaeodactylibacter sp.]
ATRLRLDTIDSQRVAQSLKPFRLPRSDFRLLSNARPLASVVMAGMGGNVYSYMKRLLIIFLINTIQTGYGYSQVSKMDSVIQAVTYPISTSDGTFSGEGWNKLIAHADTTELVLFGENHGLREIAGFANALYRKLSIDQPRILVTEIGPATAREVEILVRR